MWYFETESNMLDMMLSEAACECPTSLSRAHVYYQNIIKGVIDVRAQRNTLNMLR